MNSISIGFAREIYSPDKPVMQNSVKTGYSVYTDIKNGIWYTNSLLGTV